MKPIILASSSPRRRDILSQMGIPFLVMEPDIDETPSALISPSDQALTFARAKVERILMDFPHCATSMILGADTVIDLDDRLIGKPEGEREARDVLRSLSGRTHEVITGIALYSPHSGMIETRVTISTVDFAEISGKELDWYIGTGEWHGVAGSYRIQGLGAVFVSSIEGTYSAIAGLPIHEFYGMLRDAGYEFD